MKKILLVVASISLFSCEMLLIDTPLPYVASDARLLLYMHSTSSAPPDISFTISKIEIQDEDNNWIRLMDGPIEINSVDLTDSQMFLKDAGVKPGVYKNVRISLSSAVIKGRGADVNLALPEPGGDIVIKLNLKLQRKEILVVSFVWVPERSVEKGYMFQPSSLKVEPQAPAALGLLLFVSNSGSNYISVIDRSLERVIGAVTVGDRPMGMAFNSTQDKLYVVNAGSRDISIIDTAQLYVMDTIYLTAGIEPIDLVNIPDTNNPTEGKLYIINRASNDVTVVSTMTKRVLKTIAVGTYPSAIAADTVRKEIYVTNERSNNLSIINAIDDTLVANIAVDSRPAGIAVEKDKIYVFNEGSHRISVVSASLRKVISAISVEGPPRRGMKGLGSRLFVANTDANTVTFLSSQDVITRTILVGVKPLNLAGDWKRNRIYITNYGGESVSLVDPLGERVLKELFVGGSPYGILLLER